MSTVITQILTSLRKGSEAGRIKTDDRGNNVWDWNNGKEDADIEATSTLLSRLNNEQLSLVDHDITDSAPEINIEEKDEVGGFNPYSVGANKPKDPFPR
ncbi:MAG: hypothetical protein P8R04_03040 [Gammaproteobacteria bacterium]|nr:hypothetical protein [Gammaproteobacteria bacterium]